MVKVQVIPSETHWWADTVKAPCSGWWIYKHLTWETTACTEWWGRRLFKNQTKEMLTDLLCFIKLLKKPEVRILGLWHLTAQYRVLNVTLALPSKVFYIYDFLVDRSQYPHIPFLFSIIITLGSSPFKSLTEVYLFQERNFFWVTSVSWVVIFFGRFPLGPNCNRSGEETAFSKCRPTVWFQREPWKTEFSPGLSLDRVIQDRNLGAMHHCMVQGSIPAGLQLCSLSLQQLHYPMWSLKHKKTHKTRKWP